MNVAITRAKELLVVVGKGALLQRDPYWKSFLQFCLRNGLCVSHYDCCTLLPRVNLSSIFFSSYDGPELDLDMDGNYISRLE